MLNTGSNEIQSYEDYGTGTLQDDVANIEPCRPGHVQFDYNGQKCTNHGLNCSRRGSLCPLVTRCQPPRRGNCTRDQMVTHAVCNKSIASKCISYTDSNILLSTSYRYKFWESKINEVLF